ncbi:MAG: CinA family protein [bacterium]
MPESVPATEATAIGRLAGRLLDSGLRMTAAESCTGGWIAKTCTDLAGSSAWFERGFVTYSNESKQELLGVDASDLAEYGAVSEAVARAMAIGALDRSHADISVAVTGIAGPGGGSAEKPVGTVWFCWAFRNQTVVRCEQFSGDREQVRWQTVVTAIQGVVGMLESSG